MSKTGLVLEGGGFRGIYTAGVLDVFLERGISFDGVIGVSAGAIHACSYLSKQKGRSIRYYKKYCKDWRFMSFRSWIKTGDIVGADFCYHELPDKLDIYDHEAFEADSTPFYAVCTNVETGESEYFSITDLRAQIDHVRASASLPYFSRIVELEDKKLLDGGCSDSIPLAAFERMGYGRNLVILTRPADYRKKPELRFLPELVYGRRFPAFAKLLKSRHELYNAALDYLAAREAAGAAFVIRPSRPLEISRMEADVEKIEAAYALGRQDAETALEPLKKWLEEKTDG